MMRANLCRSILVKYFQLREGDRDFSVIQGVVDGGIDQVDHPPGIDESFDPPADAKDQRIIAELKE